VWLWLSNSDDKLPVSEQPVHLSTLETTAADSSSSLTDADSPGFLLPLSPQGNPDSAPESSQKKMNQKMREAPVDPQLIVNDYILAWRNKDKETLEQLWEIIKTCDKCLLQLVDMIVNKNLEEGMMLELAIKMAALDSDLVLPVFDALIDPMGNKSAAIILAEKMMINGRPELVKKMFDLIYKAHENGYENFAWQLTWVISKLNNHAGISPILDTVSGRVAAAPGYSKHVSSVFSKVVSQMEDSESVADLMASYYQGANPEEQQRLWEVVSKHGETLVMLASAANRNGQYYEMQQYANAIAQLPHLQAVDSLVKLHIDVEYAPDYLGSLLADTVKSNPTVKVLQKLEDYMRDPAVAFDSRIYAAEGLLAVKNNRQARYILEKVVNNSQYADPQLQAYIGGRL